MELTPSANEFAAKNKLASAEPKGQEGAGLPTILVATTDPYIEENVGELLKAYPIRTVWVKCVEELRSALTRGNVAACLCGFWLVDGTYRDVVRYIRRQPADIPVVMMCAPACPHEYRDYLAALNIRAFDFICYPYQGSHLGRILEAAIQAHNQSIRLKEDPRQPTLAVGSGSNSRTI